MKSPRTFAVLAAIGLLSAPVATLANPDPHPTDHPSPQPTDHPSDHPKPHDRH